MIKRRASLRAALIARLVPALLVAAASIADARAEPALWKIEGGRAEIWLFGTYHLLPDDLDWRFDDLQDALAAADTLYLEAPIDKVDRNALTRFVVENGYYGPETTLWEAIGNEDAQRLLEIAFASGLAPLALERMKPWLANVTLTERIAAQEGFLAANGADLELAAVATDLRIDIAYLETIEQQMGFMADLPEEEQIKALRLSLDQFETAPGLFHDMFSAWNEGDEGRLSTLLSQGSDEAPALWEVLVADRNEAWADVIEDLLQSDATILIAVGAGHLVGEDSVIELLERRGYTAARQ